MKRLKKRLEKWQEDLLWALDGWLLWAALPVLVVFGLLIGAGLCRVLDWAVQTLL